MEFALSEEQKMLEASLRGFLSDRLPMERRRAIAAAGSGHDPEIWAGLVAQGIAGLAVPERHGGAGLRRSRRGRGRGEPRLSRGARRVCREPGDGAAGAAGERHGGAAAGVAAAGSPPARRASRSASPALSARPARPRSTFDGKRLSGRVHGVLDGGGATHVLVYLADGRPRSSPSTPRAFAATCVASLDRTRPLLDVTFDDAPAVVLSAANDPLAARTRVLDAGRVMLAADTLGAAQSMFDQAVAFAKERVQFGRVIGSFQGVKHTLADLATMLEPCRALVWFAAHAQDALPDEARLAALQAKAHLGRRRPRGRPACHRGARRHGLHRPARSALLVQAHRLQSPAARHARALPPRSGRRAGLDLCLTQLQIIARERDVAPTKILQCFHF